MKSVWVTWEDHRRSRELAKAFDASYFPIIFNKNRFIRYPVLSFLTIRWLLIERPDLVFSQNPSIVLSFLLVILTLNGNCFGR